MTHDALCPTLLCNHNDKGECWWGDLECPNPCRCDLIAQVRQDMLAKCIAELHGLEADMANWSSEETNTVTDVVPDLTVDQWVWAQRGVGRSLQVLRALQDQP